MSVLQFRLYFQSEYILLCSLRYRTSFAFLLLVRQINRKRVFFTLESLDRYSINVSLLVRILQYIAVNFSLHNSTISAFIFPVSMNLLSLCDDKIEQVCYSIWCGGRGSTLPSSDGPPKVRNGTTSELVVEARQRH